MDSPSWDPDSCSASQEITRILWKPKFRFRVHINRPSVSILSQIKQIRALPIFICKRQFIIIFQLRLGIPRGLLNLQVTP